MSGLKGSVELSRLIALVSRRSTPGEMELLRELTQDLLWGPQFERVESYLRKGDRLEAGMELLEQTGAMGFSLLEGQGNRMPGLVQLLRGAARRLIIEAGN